MDRFRVLPGLPATGDWPVQFSATGRGTHSEGFVVEFLPEKKPSWVGNFQPGLTRYDAVLPLPSGTSLIVVAGGQAYVIDADDRSLLTTFGGQIDTALFAPEASLVILSNGIDLEAWNANSRRWKTRRISWDGIWDLKVDQEHVRGQAWNPFDDCEVPFSVDLRTGDVEGGSYHEAV
jgi:hypothetical protein